MLKADTHRPLPLLALAGMLTMAIATPARATQFTLANGGFRFQVPDGWPRIMQTQGDPETLVFQVPDPSPTRRNALARVSVTSQHVQDIVSFGALVAEDTNHAHALPHFQLDKQRSSTTTLHYTALEGKVQQTYVEHYYFRDGYAIQIRCVRPTHSQAGAAWTAAFDQGCASITASLGGRPSSS